MAEGCDLIGLLLARRERGGNGALVADVSLELVAVDSFFFFYFQGRYFDVEVLLSACGFAMKQLGFGRM